MADRPIRLATGRWVFFRINPGSGKGKRESCTRSTQGGPPLGIKESGTPSGCVYFRAVLFICLAIVGGGSIGAPTPSSEPNKNRRRPQGSSNLRQPERRARQSFVIVPMPRCQGPWWSVPNIPSHHLPQNMSDNPFAHTLPHRSLRQTRTTRHATRARMPACRLLGNEWLCGSVTV